VAPAIEKDHGDNGILYLCLSDQTVYLHPPDTSQDAVSAKIIKGYIMLSF